MLLMEDSMLYSSGSSSMLMQHSSSSYDCGSSVGNGFSSVGNGFSSVGNGFSSVGGGSNIEHFVTRFDTLAGVAIKYGVEVADIKRMNGLTTDLQMFARKSLRIPSPGRFPPSHVISNGCHTQGQTSSEMTHPSSRYSDSFSPIRSLKLSASPQRNISSSVNSLRDYYGLAANDQSGVGEGFGTTQTSPQPLGLHRKSKSEANGFSMISRTDKVPTANEKSVSSDKSIEKLVRRRKSEVDLNNHTPEALFRSIELQPNTANVTSTEPEPGAPSMIPLGSRDSSMSQVFNGVRKSSSAPTFQQSDTNNNSNNSPPRSSIWLTSMLNLKADLQQLSISAITSPLFDGLPKPTSGRKNKAARD